MTTSVCFPKPKDPQSSVLYELDFGEPISSVNGVTCAVSTATPPPALGLQWSTQGDAVSGSPLTASSPAVAADGHGVAVTLSGGVPGTAYAVRADVVLTAGGERFGSAILFVTGL